MGRAGLLLCLFIWMVPASWVGTGVLFWSGAAVADTVGTETGLPIPRYVTLRAKEVNVRAGPGSRFPIEWVFQRPDLPVEIVTEFDTWRKVRDVDGTEDGCTAPCCPGAALSS